MKAVQLTIYLVFALLMSGQQVFAQEEQNALSAEEDTSANVIDLTNQQEESPVSTEETPADAAIDEATEQEIKEAADLVINEMESMPVTENEFPAESQEPPQDQQTEVTPEPSDITETTETSQTPQANEIETTEQSPSQESAGEPLDQAIVDAIKSDISERRKSSGKLDIFDAETNKVRTLDLIEFKSGVKQDEDNEVVQADFRDTSSGDIVTMDIRIKKEDAGYTVKEMVIAKVAGPQKQEVKAEYSDEEVLAFMKDYIDVQSQATGTFDLYDEKTQKMRNLQFGNLDQKIRRYGIIAIATAEFTDINTGDTVTVDVNAENKNGLAITAMRLKSVKKTAPKQ